VLPLLRVALLVLAVAACNATEHPPPDMAPPPEKPSSCGKVCTADDLDCTSFSYENLPPRCQEVCYLGGCCEFVDGMWGMRFVHCALPSADAGVDAP